MASLPHCRVFRTTGGYVVELTDPLYRDERYCYVFTRDGKKSDFVGMMSANECYEGALPKDENHWGNLSHDMKTSIRRLLREAFPPA